MSEVPQQSSASTSTAIPFKSGLGLGRWFILLHAGLAVLAFCLTHGYFRWSGLFALVLLVELSGVLGKRFAFLWSDARWFRWSMFIQTGFQIAFALTPLEKFDPDLAFVGMAAGLFLPVLFLIPMSRYRVARGIPAFRPPSSDPWD
jgi:hypothetical protein